MTINRSLLSFVIVAIDFFFLFFYNLWKFLWKVFSPVASVKFYTTAMRRISKVHIYNKTFPCRYYIYKKMAKCFATLSLSLRKLHLQSLYILHYVNMKRRTRASFTYIYIERDISSTYTEFTNSQMKRGGGVGQTLRLSQIWQTKYKIYYLKVSII